MCTNIAKPEVPSPGPLTITSFGLYAASLIRLGFPSSFRDPPAARGKAQEARVLESDVHFLLRACEDARSLPILDACVELCCIIFVCSFQGAEAVYMYAGRIGVMISEERVGNQMTSNI